MNHEEFLKQVALGDREAFHQLYLETGRSVYSFILSILKNPQDAQDMTQDVFVQIWERGEQYRPTGSPMGWILTICRNLCLMQLRNADRRENLNDEEWNAIPDRETGLPQEEKLLLQDTLAVLGEEERRLVLLHAVTGLKHREIAGLLEMPLSTVLSKYHRALKKMRVYLKGDDAL